MSFFLNDVRSLFYGFVLLERIVCKHMIVGEKAVDGCSFRFCWLYKV